MLCYVIIDLGKACKAHKYFLSEEECQRIFEIEIEIILSISMHVYVHTWKGLHKR